MNIHDKYSAQVTTQSYGGNPSIDGVELVTSQVFGDDSGVFCEVARLSDGQIEGLQTPFTVKQLSMSLMVPGTIKAYHLHYKQDDLWFVAPQHRVVVNLHDVREDSPTYDTHMRVILGGCKNQVLRIPAGVAHGAANPYNQDQMLFYATSEQFSAEAPDEQRLPWDTFGAEVWEVAKG